MNLSKSLIIKAEQECGLDVVVEVMEAVEKRKSPSKLWQYYSDNELMDHAKCVELLYTDEEGELSSYTY